MMRQIVMQVSFRLRVDIAEGDGWVVASAPDLNVASQGKDSAEAYDNLYEAIQLFIGSCYERGTLDEVLMDCGLMPAYQTVPCQESLKAISQPAITVELPLVGQEN